MTNLDEAYQNAAMAFVKTVVQGEPTHIVKKLEKCPILRDVKLSDDGGAVFFKATSNPNEISRVELPSGVKLKKSVSYEIIGQENEEDALARRQGEALKIIAEALSII